MEVSCVNCHGKGVVYRLGGNGMKYPIVCAGCMGTGKQTVRGSSGLGFYSAVSREDLSPNIGTAA